MSLLHRQRGFKPDHFRLMRLPLGDSALATIHRPRIFSDGRALPVISNTVFVGNASMIRRVQRERFPKHG